MVFRPHNEAVSKQDPRIDELYQLPPGEFTAARNALAKTLTGDAAREVKALAKPAVVPWAINQLYWRARPVYDRLLKAGHELRTAQIAALKGRAADVRKATEAHRQALAGAVQRSTELASAAGSHPDAEALARTLETLSLAPEPPEAPGRLTKPLQPAGFEALAGLGAVHAAPTARPVPSAKSGRTDAGHVPGERKLSAREAASAKREAAAERARLKEQEKREREEDAERRRREAAVHAAERVLDEARAAERRARDQFEAAQSRVMDAEQRLAAARAHAR